MVLADPTNPVQVLNDVGVLSVAPLGVTAPAVNALTPLPVGWRTVGSTMAGSSFTFTPTFVGIYVEEEFDPIRWALTKRENMVEFEMMESTRANLALALNAGANAANDGTTLTPPAPGTELRVQLVWASNNGELWYFPQCIQTGPILLDRKKAPAMTMIKVQFHMEKPSGQFPFTVFPGVVQAGAVGTPI